MTDYEKGYGDDPRDLEPDEDRLLELRFGADKGEWTEVTLAQDDAMDSGITDPDGEPRYYHEGEEVTRDEYFKLHG